MMIGDENLSIISPWILLLLCSWDYYCERFWLTLFFKIACEKENEKSANEWLGREKCLCVSWKNREKKSFTHEWVEHSK